MERAEACALLGQYVQETALIKHCVAVEIAMRAYAKRFNESEEYWGTVGLLHDIDFELYPHEHPHHAREILGKAGFDEVFIVNVESHARDWPEERSLLQKTLLSVDEMTGFVIACALVRPDRSLKTLEVKSVKKKMKDKAFARAVNRETLLDSAAQLGIPLEDHIAFVTQALAVAVEDPEYIHYQLL